MRTLPALLAAATLALAGPAALAQTAGRETATGMSGPASNRASNIDHADTAGGIAPHLPQPDAPDDAGPATLLRAADQALAERRTGAAQQALEMAETRMLDRSTEIGASGQPNQDPRVLHIRAALQALGRGDVATARAGIAVALNGAMPPGPMQGSPIHVPMANPR